MGRFENQVAVVTGGAGGIGHGLAVACLNEGMKVVLADVYADRLKVVEKNLQDRFGEDRVSSFVVDMGVEEEVKALAAHVIEMHGEVNMLFNNCGIDFHKNFMLMTDNDFEFMMRCNVWSNIYGMRHFIPLLNKTGKEAHLISTVAQGALFPTMTMSAYTMTKHAVNGLVGVVACEQEMKGSKIQFLIYMPGTVRSDLMHTAAIIRPDRYKNSIEEQDFFDKMIEEKLVTSVGVPYPDPLPPGTIENEEAGAQVMEAIKSSQRYLLPTEQQKAAAMRMARGYCEGQMPPVEELL